MDAYNFYYDESEHSRKITYDTIGANNYYDNFVTVIAGFPTTSEKSVFTEHAAFEEKYAARKDKNGELKSTTLKQNQFKFGFASMNKQNVQFIGDFLSLFSETDKLYFSISSKIEFIILQLFCDYKNSFLLDTDAMKYSITKALITYQPSNVIECLCNSPEKFVDELKKFFRERIEVNSRNPSLKGQESQAFSEILSCLEEITAIPDQRWDYRMPFVGFEKYLREENIQKYDLLLDKEGEVGEDSRTLATAKEIGFHEAHEANSKDFHGLRIADMMAGIITKLLKALCDSLRYHSFEECTDKKLLDPKWFQLNESQLQLYKKLFRIVCVWDHAWYKSYSGIYSDDLVTFNALLNFMNHFESVEQIRADIDMQGEYFNAFACEQLAGYFERRRFKLPVEPVVSFDKESYMNERGGKVYFDSKKQPLLPLSGTSQTFEVLSVGVDQNFTPTVTVLKDGEPVCFRLPEELSEWACNVVGMALMGIRIFPANVTFSKINEMYDAEIL